MCAIDMKPLHETWRTKKYARDKKKNAVLGASNNFVQASRKTITHTACETPELSLGASFQKDGLDSDILAAIENMERSFQASDQRPPTAQMCKTSLHGTSTPNGQSSMEKSPHVCLSPIAPSQQPPCTQNNASPAITATPDPHLLRNWGLPHEIVSVYEKHGLVQMFPWQVQCLTLEGVLSNGANLVYSAPTSAGKTLVAEILMLKRVLETRTKALIVLPFVSVAREKMHSLQALFRNAGLKVGGYMGNHRPTGGFAAVDVAVCTIEKANSLINRLVEEGALKLLGTVVIDELHMVGDASRGYLLELLLTKIMYMQKRGKSQDKKIQVIGMSATLPNLQSLARWLDAALLSTDFRPVPLKEMFKVGPDILIGSSLEHVRSLVGVPEASLPNDPEQLMYLCLETLMSGHALLVFCPTKKWCESLANTLARCIFDLGRQVGRGMLPPAHERMGEKLRELLDSGKISDVLDQLRQTPAGLDSALSCTVPYGVAFHHAGLTMDERDVIEGAFRRGVLKVIVATSTLSSGVNLPARRVIIRTPRFHGAPIDMLTYKQMVGRAGRKGIDTEGESILMCKESERSMAEQISHSELKPIGSCLGRGGGGLSSSLKRAILEVIASGVATSTEDLFCYTRCTLLHAVMKGQKASPSCEVAESEKAEPIHECVQFLVDNEFIHLQGEDDNRRYAPTQLGRAVLASSLSPDEGLCVLRELQQARQSFVLENDLHLIYQVTPITLSAQLNDVDWTHYLELWERLPPDKRRVADLVGIEERFLVKAARGRGTSLGPRQARAMAVHLRFYVALALEELVQEVPLPVVAAKYGCPKGLLQSLQQSAATYAGMVSVFCKRLGWHNMELLVSQFQSRLHFGVQPELCELLHLPSLDGRLARQLYDMGQTDPATLAQLEPQDLELLLKNAGPFQSAKHSEEDIKVQGQKTPRRRVWLVGHAGLTELEAAHVIVKEARAFVEETLGAKVNWAKCAEVNQSEPSKQPKEVPDIGITALEGKADVQNVIAEVTGVEGRSHIKSGVSKKSAQQNSQNSSAVHPSSAVECARKNEENVEEHNREPFPQSQGEHHLREGAIEDSHPVCVEPTNRDKSVVQERSSKGCSSAEDQTREKQEEDSVSDIGLDSVQWLCFSSEDSICRDSPFNEKKVPKRGDVTVTRSTCSSQQLKHSSKISQTNTRGNANKEPTQRTSVSASPFLQNTCLSTRASGKAQPYPEDIRGQGPVAADDEAYAMSETLFLDTQTVMALDGACTVGMLKENKPLEDCAVKRTPNVTGTQNRQSMNTRPCLQDTAKQAFQVIPESEDLFSSPVTEFPARQSLPSLTESEKELFSASSSPFSLQSPEKCAKDDVQYTPKEQHDASQPRTPLVLRLSPFSSGSCSSKRSSSPETSQEKSPKLLRLSSDCEIFTPDNSGTDICSPPALHTSDVSSPGHSVSLQILLEKFCVVNVASDNHALNSFTKECRRRSYFALWLVLEEYKKQPSNSEGIGPRKSMRMKAKENCAPAPLVFDGKELVAVVVFWGGYKAHYLKLKQSNCNMKTCPVSTTEPGVQQAEVLQVVDSLIRAGATIGVYDALRTFKILNAGCGVQFDVGCKWEDPKVAHWLLDTSETQPHFSALAKKWTPHLLSFLSGETSMSPVSWRVTGSPCSCLQAAKASVALYYIGHATKAALRDANLYRLYEEMEMPILVPLAKMDLNGLGFCEKRGERARAGLQGALDSLAAEVHKLYGQKFQISSSKATTKALHKVLDPLLKFNEDLRKIMSTENNITSKDVLLQLAAFHSLPKKIVDWRKINSILSRNLNPVLRNKAFSEPLSMYRVYTTSNTFVATGRVSLHEPNLQAIARDFEASMDAPTILCLRDAFIPFAGSVLLSADYSQLELRLLAHFSRDKSLCSVFRKGGDVFKDMAARLKSMDVAQVTDPLRQQAKQVCYGIVYGRGCSSLAEELGMDRVDAEKLVADFRRTFPGAYSYTEKVKEQCRSCGYVTTLRGRRRLLPEILSTDASSRSHAERQAVNTTIQGSAADLLKTAILAIDRELQRVFSECTRTHRTKGSASVLPTSGAFPVLQLHDELIYEVCLKDLRQVARIVKTKMEAAAQLLVPLVVKTKTGLSWGSLRDYEF
ncbi:DNA polymerase theta-like isoform X2 [Ornithodoros turicata]|uniref:DNA polymerase theta-like isoform X2 n=1 Tax=Ornithodoros turicata TaxID=34597 RepID=UPI0031386C6F